MRSWLHCCWESEWHIICHNRRTSSHRMGWQELCCHSNPHAFPTASGSPHPQHVREDTNARHKYPYAQPDPQTPTSDSGPPRGKWHREADVRDERLFQNSTMAITWVNHCNNESWAMSRGALRYPEAPGLQHYGRPPYPRKLFFFKASWQLFMSNFGGGFLVNMQVNILLTFTTLFCIKCEYKWICKFTLCHKVALRNSRI